MCIPPSPAFSVAEHGSKVEQAQWDQGIFRELGITMDGIRLGMVPPAAEHHVLQVLWTGHLCEWPPYGVYTVQGSKEWRQPKSEWACEPMSVGDSRRTVICRFAQHLLSMPDAELCNRLATLRSKVLVTDGTPNHLDHTHVIAAITNAMAGRSPNLAYRLGKPRRIDEIFLQAEQAAFLIEQGMCTPAGTVEDLDPEDQEMLGQESQVVADDPAEDPEQFDEQEQASPQLASSPETASHSDDDWGQWQKQKRRRASLPEMHGTSSAVQRSGRPELNVAVTVSRLPIEPFVWHTQEAFVGFTKKLFPHEWLQGFLISVY